MAREKIGLALGGGAAKGLAHIGVLEVLEKEGIRFDMIAGTSAGAAIGALHAQGKTAAAIKELALNMDWKQRARLVDLTFPKTGFIAGKKIRKLLESIIGDVSFSDLEIPLACTATDLMTGEEIVIDRGSVIDAVRASISIPVILSIAKWQGRFLVDGVLVDPVPVTTARAMGADKVIAVNLLHTGQHVDTRKIKTPNIFNVMMQTVHIPSDHLVKTSLSGADIIIEPDLSAIGFADFHLARESIRRGQLAAADAIPHIKRLLAA